MILDGERRKDKRKKKISKLGKKVQKGWKEGKGKSWGRWICLNTLYEILKELILELLGKRKAKWNQAELCLLF